MKSSPDVCIDLSTHIRGLCSSDRLFTVLQYNSDLPLVQCWVLLVSGVYYVVGV